MSYSAAFDRALIIAALAHRGQLRKGTRIPYVMHPFHVSVILAGYGYGPPLTIAALLHDVLEDMPFEDGSLQHDFAATFPGYQWPAPIDAADFRRAVRAFLLDSFGPDVVRLVEAVTEQKRDDKGDRPWRQRRQEQLDHLAHAPTDVALLKAADALHNASSIAADIREGRATLAGRFNVTPEQTVWYYREVARLARERSGGAPIVDALDAAIEEISRLASSG